MSTPLYFGYMYLCVLIDPHPTPKLGHPSNQDTFNLSQGEEPLYLCTIIYDVVQFVYSTLSWLTS